MPILYLLHKLFELSIGLAAAVITVLITELCSRFFFRTPKRNSFWRESVVVASVFFAWIVLFYALLPTPVLESLMRQFSAYGGMLSFLIPPTIGLLLGLGAVSLKLFNTSWPATVSLSNKIQHIVITTLLTVPATFISWLIIFFAVSGPGGSIQRYSYDSFHLFNQHVKDLCFDKNTNEFCPKDLDELAAFNPERFKKFTLLVPVQYEFNEESDEYYFSAYYNPHRVMSSSNANPYEANTLDEAKAKGLWR